MSPASFYARAVRSVKNLKVWENLGTKLASDQENNRMTNNDHTLTQLRCVLLRVYGHVQGVVYRASAQEQANGLGLIGWIRNRSDGSVQAMVQGVPDDVAQFIDWAKQGPAAATISNVELEEQVPDPQLEATFTIRATTV